MTPQPLAVRGHSDFSVTVTASAEQQKQDALALASGIVAVTTIAEQQDAITAVSLMKGLTVAMEQTRVAVKKPVLSAAKEIDDTAKIYSGKLEAEIRRLQVLASQYQAEQNRIAAEARAAEERAQHAQRCAEDEERLADNARIAAAADEAERAAAMQAADEAAERRADAERQRSEQLRQLAAPKAAGASVRVQLDYEVSDIHVLYRVAPHLVKLEPKRADILTTINIPKAPALPGLRVFEVTKVQAKADTVARLNL